MHMRPATTRDLHRLTEITTTSLVDDPTYDYLCPLRKEYPEDNYFYWQLKLEEYLYDKRITFLVVEIDREDEHGHDDNYAANPRKIKPAPTIISYGIWERFGSNKAAIARFAAKNTWLNALDCTNAKVARWSVGCKYQRRDLDRVRLEANENATRAVKRKYFSDAADWWSMELLVTDRAFRRRGAATRLVQWGTAQADLESLFCGVEASLMGSGVYSASGFKKLERWIVKVPGESETLPFEVMRREPHPIKS